MLGKRLINSNDAAAGGACTTNTNDYPTTNVAYYKMSTAADEKDTYNGTATDVNFNVAGKFGNAGEFNGSSSYISVPTLGGSFYDSDFSISLWVNLNSLGGASTAYLFSGAGSRDVFMNFNTSNSGGGISARLYDGTVRDVVYSSAVVGNWYHVVFVRSKTSGLNLYVDGVSRDTNTFTGNAQSISFISDGIGGRVQDRNTTDGKIDQVRIFDSALNATQVESLYNEVYCVPTIVPTDHFEPVLYTGNGGTKQITTLDFQPDFTWIKSRNAVGSHIATDSVRGNGKEIYTDLTNAQGTVNRISLTSTGFDVVSAGYPNQTNNTFVSWNWKAGGAAVSNTDGTITSQVSANVDAGFSIVEYSGTNSVTDTVGHGLSETPEMVIVKNTSASKSWAVRHAVLASTQNIFLNATNGATTITATATGGVGVINSTTFGFAAGGTNASNVNISGNDFIAYAFHSVDGYSKIGSYTGTGASGNTIVTGFRPAFVMIKQTSSIGADNHWNMWDNKRVEEDMLRANTNSSEFAGPGRIDFLSNGFEMLDSDTSRNASGGTYIFMAFAEEAASYVTRNATDPFGDSSELALYKFEDNANDAEGNYNGTASNVTYASGYIDKAAVFNGSSSSIDTNSASMYSAKSKITLSAWVNFSNLNTTNPILSGSGTFGFYTLGNGYLYFAPTNSGVNSGGYFQISGLFTTNQWVNIIMVFDGTKSNDTDRLKAYIDGNLITLTYPGFVPTSTGTSTSSLLIGESIVQSAFFSGSIDQVRIFDRALDSGEVTALYNE